MSLWRRRIVVGPPKPKLPDCLVPVVRQYDTACPNPDGVSPYHRGYLARSKTNPYANSNGRHRDLWLLGRMDRLTDAEKPLPIADRRTV